jgi:hypothetical protein
MTNHAGYGEIKSSFAVTVYARSWSGSRTPNFARVFEEGKLPVNPHSVYILECNPGYGFIEEIWYSPGAWYDSRACFGPGKYGGGGGVQGWDPAPYPPATHDTSKRNLAIKRLQDVTSGSMNNVALDILEVNQFTRMVANTAARVTGAVRALKNGNIPKAVQSIWQGKQPRYRRGGGPKPGASVADNWLEMQYGWKPLLADAKGAAENLARLNIGNREVQIVKSSSTTRQNNIVSKPYNGLQQNVIVTTIKFGLRYKVSSPVALILAQTGFTNPLNLAWEVIPFSFVVDWFLPIGAYLESLSSWDGLDFIDGYETRFTRERMIQTFAYENRNKAAGHDTRAYGDWNAQAIRLDRLKLTAFPSQTPPSFKNPFSLTHSLNALALMRAVFR